jgi:hypothetical protein
MKTAVWNTDLHPMGKGLARIISCNAGAAGAEARVDDRAVVANRLPKLLPFGGAPGFRRDTHFPYSRTDIAHQGFPAKCIHHES